jgi:Na+/H+ antiporter NhaC
MVFGINLEEEFDNSKKCGAQNCPQTKLKGSKATPTDASKFLFYIILIILIVAALVITFLFMENLNAVEQKEKKMSLKIIGQRFKTEIKNLFKIYMNADIWLMLPLTI